MKYARSRRTGRFTQKHFRLHIMSVLGATFIASGIAWWFAPVDYASVCPVKGCRFESPQPTVIDQKRLNDTYKLLRPELSIKDENNTKEETQKQKVLKYLVEKFGDRSPDAITIINLCENHSFDPKKVSGLNIQQSGRRSYDIGVMQINAEELDVKEQERLKDYVYNIDRGYAKYKAAGNTFRAWSCAHVIGEKNYLGK